ncbi:hypothetical protein ABH922_002010 [Rhodococcus sp. 27YEA15]
MRTADPHAPISRRWAPANASRTGECVAILCPPDHRGAPTESGCREDHLRNSRNCHRPRRRIVAAVVSACDRPDGLSVHERSLPGFRIDSPLPAGELRDYSSYHIEWDRPAQRKFNRRSPRSISVDDPLEFDIAGRYRIQRDVVLPSGEMHEVPPVDRQRGNSISDRFTEIGNRVVNRLTDTVEKWLHVDGKRPDVFVDRCPIGHARILTRRGATLPVRQGGNSGRFCMPMAYGRRRYVPVPWRTAHAGRRTVDGSRGRRSRNRHCCHLLGTANRTGVARVSRSESGCNDLIGAADPWLTTVGAEPNRRPRRPR